MDVRTSSALLCSTLLAGAIIIPAVVAAAGEVTMERLVHAAAEPHNWLTHHGTLDAWRFSRLDQINRENVENLKVAWTFALGGTEPGGIWPHGGLEDTPIVEDGMLYVTDGWGSVYKIDATGGHGRLVWKMDPKTDKDWAGAVACCGVNNRGVALWKDKVVSHTLDGRLVVTNKETGEVEWERQVADPAIAETVTAAPLIIDDLAITGVSGAEYGIRGWLAATDLNTQQEVWRRHTIPAPGEPGHDSWADENDAWKTGGGSTWVVGSYDPALKLLYWGVGNPGPDWDSEYRPGDNLYTNSKLALDPTSGEIRWYYQFTPNDPYDYDGVAEGVLADVPVNGTTVPVMLHADRNGFAYALDRRDGRFLWGVPFVDKLTWTRGLDPESGLPLDYDPALKVQTYVLGTAPSRSNPTGTSCPGNMGGKNWPPTAYSPIEQLWYIPVIESCNDMTNQVMEYKPREFFTGGGPKSPYPITGSIAALDARTGAIVAKHRTDYPMLGGVLATQGGLVFAGDPDGTVMALDARTLELRWSFETGSGLNAPPVSYAIDGKQYVAILVGLGGAWPKWFVESTPGLETIPPSSMLYVFSL